MNISTFIEELISVTKNNLIVSEKLAELSDKQLDWKPSSNVWSIKENIAHLNGFSSYYQNKFKIKIFKTKFKTPSTEFISSPLGKSTWNAIKLGKFKNIKRKFKSAKIYNPEINLDLLRGDLVKKLIENQNEMIQIIEDSKNVSLKRVKIPISTSTIIRLRLGDAMLYHVYHNERHIQTIQTLLNHPNFPNS